MKKMRKGVKIALCILLTLVLIAGAYVAYVFIDYHRIGDYTVAELVHGDSGVESCVDVGKPYTALSYNIGFAAYLPDYGFFMDGGTESRARSKESVVETMEGIENFLDGQNADFMLLEEVDEPSTRSHHVNELQMLREHFAGEHDSAYARNYDSPYLFYPFLSPIGKSVSGIVTLSRYRLVDSIRRSLPIETGVMKLVDLDRCYTVSRVPVANGKVLAIFTFHLSAYTSDGTIATEQLEILLGEMQKEYEKGNYCIAGGDFNKDLLVDSSKVFGVDKGEYTWAQPIPAELFTRFGIRMIAPFNEEKPVPSCRNADGPYNPEQLVLTVDGFLASANVVVHEADVVDLGFAYSDHNPVKMIFELKD